VLDDGTLGPLATWFKNEGSGPNKSRQEAPHLHFATADPSSQYVLACDLGTDEVLSFTLDSNTSKIELANPRSIKSPEGGGPRHLVIDPQRPMVFVNNEMLSSVSAYRRGAEGRWSRTQTLSTLSTGAEATGNSTAAIALHPNGKWLYVSNRGHDSLATYEVAADGTLTFISAQPLEVKIPRSFRIDPSGTWLFAAGQESGTIRAFPLDPATGLLGKSADMVQVSKPVCLVLAKP
jgi:6-phosphogluconolactonase